MFEEISVKCTSFEGKYQGSNLLKNFYKICGIYSDTGATYTRNFLAIIFRNQHSLKNTSGNGISFHKSSNELKVPVKQGK